MTGTTRYDKIREDGWYRVSRILPTQVGAPDVHYWVNWANGITSARYEAPQLERFSTSISEPTPIIIAGAIGTVVRPVPRIEIGNYHVPKFGWMGCTIIPLTDAADLVAGFGVPFGEILTMQVNANSRSRFIYSNTSETIKFFMDNGGVTQADLDVPQAKVLQGVPLGCVATWGSHEGSNYIILAVNGIQEDLTDTTNDPPTGAGDIFIGSKADTGASPANVMVQHAAFGDRALTRNDAIQLSKWFQNSAFSALGAKGE
jgi:hypothetical protein